MLGIWAGTDGRGESAKYWMSVLAEIKNRSVQDVLFIVCDGLKGLPDSANAVFPLATIQTCIIHLIRGTFRYASKKYWDRISRELKPIYGPVTGAGVGRVRRVRNHLGAEIPRHIRPLALVVGAVHAVP